MNNKIAIITGIGGMDAESLCEILLSKNYIVVGTYRKTTYLNLNNIRKTHKNDVNLHLEHCDITDKESINSLILNTLNKFGEIKEIYLLAAQSHVGLSFSTQETTIFTNGMSVFYFLESLRCLSPMTKTYFAATSELFGGNPKLNPFDENSPFECRSPYSIGKDLGVKWITYFQQTYGMFATYGILFNHSNTSRDLSFFIRKITNGAAKIALGKQRDLLLGNLEFFRDEHWSDFGCEMMWKMLQLEKPEIFVIGRGQSFYGEQFLDEAFNYFNLDWKKYIRRDEKMYRPNEVIKLTSNPSKAISKLGWNPNRMSFQDHINLMCAYDYNLESGKKLIKPNVFELYP